MSKPDNRIEHPVHGMIEIDPRAAEVVKAMALELQGVKSDLAECQQDLYTAESTCSTWRDEAMSNSGAWQHWQLAAQLAQDRITVIEQERDDWKAQAVALDGVTADLQTAEADLIEARNCVTELGNEKCKISSNPLANAFLQCEKCGQGQRVWLESCRACADPGICIYTDEIAELKAANKVLMQQRVDIGISLDLANAQIAELRRERDAEITKAQARTDTLEMLIEGDSLPVLLQLKDAEKKAAQAEARVERLVGAAVERGDEVARLRAERDRMRLEIQDVDAVLQEHDVPIPPEDTVHRAELAAMDRLRYKAERDRYREALEKIKKLTGHCAHWHLEDPCTCADCAIRRIANHAKNGCGDEGRPVLNPTDDKGE